MTLMHHDSATVPRKKHHAMTTTEPGAGSLKDEQSMQTQQHRAMPKHLNGVGVVSIGQAPY